MITPEPSYLPREAVILRPLTAEHAATTRFTTTRVWQARALGTLVGAGVGVALFAVAREGLTSWKAWVAPIMLVAVAGGASTATSYLAARIVTGDRALSRLVARGLLLVTLWACLLAILGTFAAAVVEHPSWAARALQSGLPLLPLVLFIGVLRLTLATRNMLRGAQLVREAPDGCILYLRPFKTDRALVERAVEMPIWARLMAALVGHNVLVLIWQSVSSSKNQNLDQVLARPFQGIGRVVALGNPQSWLPEGGSHKLYASDAHWKTDVVRLVGKSRAIIVRLDDSDGLKWELEYLKNVVDPSNVFIVTEPQSPYTTWEKRSDEWWFISKTYAEAGIALPKAFVPSGTILALSQTWQAVPLGTGIEDAREYVRLVGTSLGLGPVKEVEEVSPGPRWARGAWVMALAITAAPLVWRVLAVGRAALGLPGLSVMGAATVSHVMSLLGGWLLLYGAWAFTARRPGAAATGARLLALLLAMRGTAMALTYALGIAPQSSDQLGAALIYPVLRSMTYLALLAVAGATFREGQDVLGRRLVWPVAAAEVLSVSLTVTQLAAVALPSLQLDLQWPGRLFFAEALLGAFAAAGVVELVLRSLEQPPPPGLAFALMALLYVTQFAL